MESLNRHLDDCAKKALDAYSEIQTVASRPVLPVDLRVLAQAMGNIDIEEREMIPEAAILPIGNRFRIFLQSNFNHHHGMKSRLRFSLAHEIAHTFFFELTGDALRPMKGAPSGVQLESACHSGAGRLLIPERSLRREIKAKLGWGGPLP